MTVRVGLAVATVALLGRLAAVAAVIVVPSGAGAQETASPGTKGDSGTEPSFKPGIPGLKMVDVRDHKLLWREIEELQKWEEADRISIAEYRSKVIEKTAHFLELRGAGADAFAATATGAVAAVREAFVKSRAEADPRLLETQFSADLQGAEARLASFLSKEPRHRLFAPECKR